MLVPKDARPAVRILRLHSILDPQDARFLAVLEWAERVARLWRANGNVAGAGVVERFEDDDELLVGIASSSTAPITPMGSPKLSPKGSSSSLRNSWLIPPSLNPSPSGSPPATPRSSTHFAPASSTSSVAYAASSPTLTTPSSPASSISIRSSTTARRRKSTLPTSDPNQRPFDALISFLPRTDVVPPKVVLKHAIVATTLSRPYLTVPVRLDRAPAAKRPRSTVSPSQRWSSVFSSPPKTPSETAQSALATSLGSSNHAHLIHVLPPNSPPALARAIEAFLLNFTDAGLAGREARPAPFVLPIGHLGEPVGDKGWNIIELVLRGALDFRGQGGRASMRALEKRAWLAGAADVSLGEPPQHLPAPHPPRLREAMSEPPPRTAMMLDVPAPPPHLRAMSEGDSPPAPPLPVKNPLRYAAGMPSPPPSPPPISQRPKSTRRLTRHRDPEPAPTPVQLLTPPGSREGETSDDGRDPRATRSESGHGTGTQRRKKRWWPFGR